MKKISPPQNRKLKQSRIFPRVLTNPSTNCGTTLENTAWQWSQCKTKENFPELSCSFTTPENPPCLLSALAFTYPNISNGKKYCDLWRDEINRITSLFCTALQHLWPLWRHDLLVASACRASGAPGGWSCHQRQSSPWMPAVPAGAGSPCHFLHKPLARPAAAARRTRQTKPERNTTENNLNPWAFHWYFVRHSSRKHSPLAHL